MITSDSLATKAGRFARHVYDLRNALHCSSEDMTDEEIYYLRDSFMFIQKDLEYLRREISKLEIEAVAKWEAAKAQRLRIPQNDDEVSTTLTV